MERRNDTLIHSIIVIFPWWRRREPEIFVTKDEDEAQRLKDYWKGKRVKIIHHCTFM